MRIASSFLLAAGLLTGGCASTHPTATVGSAPNVFFSQLPTRPYQEVSFVEYTGSIFDSRARLLRRLQQRQARVQGDALVQVRYDYVLWYPHASAVVIKYQ